MRRGRLPLTALRSFEAAGRLGSFTDAARELFVSQAAISRQIRDLEASLDRSLFDRRHRGVDLTADGAALLAVLTVSFDSMEAALVRMTAGHTPPEIKLSVEPSFAAGWLVSRLHHFQRCHPGIDVSLDADPRMIAFGPNEAHLAIRHTMAARSWPGTQALFLFDVELIPVMSARLHAESEPITSPSDLLRYNLLHEEHRDWWTRWFDAAGHETVEPVRGAVFTDSGLLLQALSGHQGVALIERRFVSAEIDAGRMVQVPGASISCGTYWLVARSFERLSRAEGVFVEWLRSRI